MSSWKRMSSGKYIDLDNFTIDDVDIEDINRSLNLTYRFSGHFADEPPLTVAQHTLLCLHLAEDLFPGDREVAVGCVIHDFPEAYYGDITTPVKKKLGDAFGEFVGPIDRAVEKTFWHIANQNGPSEEVRLQVKVCDLLALDIERRMLWSNPRGKDKWPDVPGPRMTMETKAAMFHAVCEDEVDLGELLEEAKL